MTAPGAAAPGRVCAAERAAMRHAAGYNCAQAVACAFAEDVGVDERLLFRAMEGFGLGMGGRAGTCGAVSGAVAVVGLAASDGCLERPRSKGTSYRLAREVSRRFAEQAGSLVCDELKGGLTGQVLLACPLCVRLAASIAEDVVFGGAGDGTNEKG